MESQLTVSWRACGSICGSCCLHRPKPQRGRRLFVGFFSSLSFCELKDQTKAVNCGNLLIILYDTSENFSDDHYWDTETHDLTSEVYMRSLTAVFSHLCTPVAKWAVCVGHTVATVVEAPSCSPFTFPPMSVNLHRSRCAYCKVIVNDLGK